MHLNKDRLDDTLSRSTYEICLFYLASCVFNSLICHPETSHRDARCPFM